LSLAAAIATRQTFTSFGKMPLEHLAKQKASNLPSHRHDLSEVRPYSGARNNHPGERWCVSPAAFATTSASVVGRFWSLQWWSRFCSSLLSSRTPPLISERYSHEDAHNRRLVMLGFVRRHLHRHVRRNIHRPWMQWFSRTPEPKPIVGVSHSATLPRVVSPRTFSPVRCALHYGRSLLPRRRPFLLSTPRLAIISASAPVMLKLGAARLAQSRGNARSRRHGGVPAPRLVQ